MKIFQSSWFPTCAFFAAIFGVWNLAVYVMHVPVYLVPSPKSVWTAFTEHPVLLLTETLATLREVMGGFVLAVVLAVPLALGITFSRTFERYVNPAIVVSQALPKVALAPLMLVWFGFGEFPKILMAALIAFFPMLISTTVGFRDLPPDVVALARSMGGNSTRIFFKIRLPAALPNIFGGLKLAITFAVIGAVIGEFIGGDHGLGYMIQSASGVQRTDVLFAALIIISLMSLLLFYLLEVIERKFIFWHQSQIVATA